MRISLLQPIAELDLAAKLLDAAADALLAGRESLARELVVRSDLREIGAYAQRLVGKMSEAVHIQVRRPKSLPKASRDPARMPSETDQASIFRRDGWRCRFCGVRVISRAARSIFTRQFPEETRWTLPEFQRHYALYALASSLDHVLPHGRGGKNETSNFVTACYCCQFGRGEWTLEEVGLLDPRDRPPVVDSWDGLIRITKSAT